MNEDTLRDMSDDALFYGRHRDDDKDLGCSDYDPYSEENWAKRLELSGMTQEDYDRQCDDLIQMHRDDWKRKQLEAEARRIRRETGYYPDWVDDIYE